MTKKIVTKKFTFLNVVIIACCGIWIISAVNNRTTKSTGATVNATTPVPIPPKRFCQIPQPDGTNKSIETPSNIPCDFAVENAKRQIEKTLVNTKKMPDTATNQTHNPYDPPAPAIKVSPENVKNFNDDLTNTEE
jgi:hypothetical protein